MPGYLNAASNQPVLCALPSTLRFSFPSLSKDAFAALVCIVCCSRCGMMNKFQNA
eukprot:SAG31_NODE_40272_length_281_cov_5.170330_1_plen_54_part_10